MRRVALTLFGGVLAMGLIGCGGGNAETEVQPVPQDAQALQEAEDAAVRAAESQQM